MNGDDIKWHNDSLPWWPKAMPLWQRVLCLLGYHKRETRQTGKTHKFPGMKLRDQCGRCGTLL
jgi:hypothetical protein